MHRSNKRQVTACHIRVPVWAAALETIGWFRWALAFRATYTYCGWICSVYVFLGHSWTLKFLGKNRIYIAIFASVFPNSHQLLQRRETVMKASLAVLGAVLSATVCTSSASRLRPRPGTTRIPPSRYRGSTYET